MGSETMQEKRRPAFEYYAFGWHLGRIPEYLEYNEHKIPHPGLSSAIFLVHGIGNQTRTETAAQLRCGFEDAFEKIADWQEKNKIHGVLDPRLLPPPLIYEGYWGNYPDLEETFKDDCRKFSDDEKTFFEKVWKSRVLSKPRTYVWFLLQQIKLLHPRVIKEVGFLAWLTYWPLQITSFATLTLALFRYPKIITNYLADVRLYLDPRGIVERAIVQRIDYTVGQKFLELIGLDWDFRPLKETLRIAGVPINEKRIVWVAHSLGTVISYNVLSDLFHRARDIENDTGGAKYDEAQKAGVRHFRKTLKRFITLGSPLDKVAYLFKDTSLRFWPEGRRQEFLQSKDAADNKNPDKSEAGDSKEIRDWWYNFYHVMDPVSGALDSKLLFGDNPPVNRHMGRWHMPGWAHVAYWRDYESLRYILGRTYGRILKDKVYEPAPGWQLTSMAIFFQLLLVAISVLIILAIINWSDVQTWIDNIKGFLF